MRFRISIPIEICKVLLNLSVISCFSVYSGSVVKTKI